ncbi:hypothetical protein [Streptomyces tsukubensis]|uniref:Secreted protein n=1 Tax=Streptomyces tsukubensis TaxID=83656 RepID=A0A1V4A5N9_9ACTN|nr:hypothetical protein [Streptomyces tsukubensis]OON76944.1 hypothetical protein B1H18_19435 [Streptomyces tsukubensis]QFR93828.1 hypothetical protein GBW32_13085 [Streptomyces tsukubensis]
MATRRRATIVAAISLVLAAPVAVGCDNVDKALDCVQTADAIADSVTSLQQAVDSAGNDPLNADDELKDIDKNLDKLNDKTDDADLSKAVDQLQKGVGNLRTAIKDGDVTPDLSPVTDAAGELTKVCSP